MKPKIDLEEQLICLTKNYQKIKKLNYFYLTCFFCIVAVMLVSFTGNKSKQLIPENTVLRLKGVTIVDDKGIERVWIGAPVESPIVMGRRHNRGTTAHGIILLDEQGHERGSFAMHDESSAIALTMDNVSKMVYNLSTSAAGGVTEWIRDRYGNQIYMGTGIKGPFLKMIPADTTFKQVLLTPQSLK
jgi:hypothetical protein